MKKNLFYLLLCSSIIFLISCKKESSENPANKDMLGDYSFVSLTAATVSTQIVTDGTTTDKTVTVADYTTINNTGTLTIEPTKMISTGLSYSIDAVAMADIYEDNVLMDSYELPVEVSYPASNATSTYKWITSDSVYFSKGFIFSDGYTTTTNPAGAKLRLEGDKLYITASEENTNHSTQSGLDVTSIAKASIIAIYQKQ